MECNSNADFSWKNLYSILVCIAYCRGLDTSERLPQLVYDCIVERVYCCYYFLRDLYEYQFKIQDTTKMIDILS
jgi:hypothetical protein